MKALPNLTQLDLSGMMHSQGGLHGLKFLLNCPHLVSLVLHNVKEVKEALPSLTQLDRLEHLDISQVDELYGDFHQPSLFLEELVKRLPRLKSLDISGTNLAASYKESEGKGRCDGRKCDIPGLTRRIDTPLEFLGLYRTKEDACRREHIPALRVTGNHTEDQVLLASRCYMDRPLVMENLIDDLVTQVRLDMEVDLRAVLSIAVDCMRRHPREKKLLRHATALLYYLLPVLDASTAGFSRSVRQRLLAVLLTVMQSYREDSLLMRNGCMVLWRFDGDRRLGLVQEDLLLQYPKVVDILLFVSEHYSGEEETYIQRAAVFLLNSLVCQVDGDQKKVRGLDIVDGMLQVVKQKLELAVCDDVMETAWSVMWNVTDETPANSQRFLDRSGMELFLQCKEAFPNTMDLLRNMMGLLGNIAEVKKCRRPLMSAPFVNEFSFLLDSSKDGIEVGTMKHGFKKILFCGFLGFVQRCGRAVPPGERRTRRLGDGRAGQGACAGAACQGGHQVRQVPGGSWQVCQGGQ
jgi:Zyg-11 family protein